MKHNVKIHQFSNSDILADDLSKEICRVLVDAIKKYGGASLALSGGSTPLRLFDKLSFCDIPWNKVVVSLCDERWVDTQNIHSNEYLIKTNLLKNFAKEAKFIGMYDRQNSLEDASSLYEDVIKQKLLPFDIIVLGMGADGHTASLFPNNEKPKQAFGQNSTLCMSVTQKTPMYDRLTLTCKAILQAKYIFLHFEGEQKMRIFNLALESNDINRYPISCIINQETKQIEVYHA